MWRIEAGVHAAIRELKNTEARSQLGLKGNISDLQCFKRQFYRRQNCNQVIKNA